MEIHNRTLFFGDNLKILQEKIPENTFDLIYLDPPFNSNRNYNVLFKEGTVDSSAQIHAFEDTWEWTPATIRLFENLQNSPNPQIALLITSLYEFIKPTPMMAYLVNMTARLIPLKRVLKPTGSIYLHCDPTASHYLKIILDVIFEKQNFRNEIIWHYTGRRMESKYAYNSKHDVLLFYGKTEQAAIIEYPKESWTREEYLKMKKQELHVDESGREWIWGHAGKGKSHDYKIYIDEVISEGRAVDDVWGIPIINTSAKERLGYPTQKPEALLERIIKASSKEGNLILDPFCGCGTTVAVAERLNRKWVGVDISMMAINVIMDRMSTHYPRIKIHTDGIPMDFEGAVSLADKDKFAFQNWAITLIGAYPPTGEARKGADQGIDGLILFREHVSFNNPTPHLRKVIVQVKGGGTGRKDIATLKGDMDREEAPMGVLITLTEPTSEMKREAALAGEYHYSSSIQFPKVQILSIKEWFDGRNIKLPTDTINPFRQAAIKVDQKSLF
jgi:DNA modification methylase